MTTGSFDLSKIARSFKESFHFLHHSILEKLYVQNIIVCV